MPKKNNDAKPDTAEYWDDVKAARGRSRGCGHTSPPEDRDPADEELPSGSYGSSDSNEYVDSPCSGHYDDGTWVWDD